MGPGSLGPIKKMFIQRIHRLEGAAGDQAKFLSLTNKPNVDELGAISKTDVELDPIN